MSASPASARHSRTAGTRSRREESGPSIDPEDVESAAAPGEVLDTATASADASPATPGPGEERTLAYAVEALPNGAVTPLSEPVVLATTLGVLELARAAGTGLFHDASESVEAVAPLYWPFVILPAPKSGYVRLFDGAGVWRRDFYHVGMPPAEPFDLERLRSLAYPDFVAHASALARMLNLPAPKQVMTVEGALPEIPGLVDGVIAHSLHTADPQTPHAGFLPARHGTDWFEASARAMDSALDQLDGELVWWETTRRDLAGVFDEMLARLDKERRGVASEYSSRWRMLAHEETAREVDALHRASAVHIHTEIQRLHELVAVLHQAQAERAAQAVLKSRHPGGSSDRPSPAVGIRVPAEVEERARTDVREAEARLDAVLEAEREALRRIAKQLGGVEARAAHDDWAFALQRDEIVSVGEEVAAVLERETKLRRAEREALASDSRALPHLTDSRVLWCPLWVASLRSRTGTTRFVALPPVVRLGNAEDPSTPRRATGSLWGECMNGAFQEAFRAAASQALGQDTWLASVVHQILVTADVTADPNFLERLGKGLSVLRHEGRIDDKFAEAVFQSNRSRVETRILGASKPR